MYKNQGWTVPKKAGPYLWDFHQATVKYNLPEYLLIRVADQESDFEPKAFNARTKASGIMQIVPRWHPEIDDPLNPLDDDDVFNPSIAIPYAAKYLRLLYNQFGRWDHALMAYNWGPGNVKKYLNGDIDRMPEETRIYYTQIMRDVRNASKAV